MASSQLASGTKGDTSLRLVGSVSTWVNYTRGVKDEVDSSFVLQEKVGVPFIVAEG
jgi:hypothetical protein